MTPLIAASLAACAGVSPAVGGEAPAFPVYQFPADAIPRIDGKADDWAAVGPAYRITEAALAADDGSNRRPDPRSLKVTVRVGWVKGLNRLYFLYEAWDDRWRFAEPGLAGDIFELVVDGDRSGGPLIARFHPDALQPDAAQPRAASDLWWNFQNIHAQNYHIFTPPGDRDWAMAWGPQASWIKRMPWSNVAWRHGLRDGRPGRLTMEFWITPFDRADPSGPERSVETRLTEGQAIGLAWAVIDDDGNGRDGKGRDGKPRRAFWNLSPHHTMYGQASQLCPFRLMPPAETRPFAAEWSFAVLDRERRVVAFRDDTAGPVARRRWDFGDGTGSTQANPVHGYASAGKFTVTLEVQGPRGTARHAKVWDVSFTGDPPK